MPCYDKKLEASRQDFYNDTYKTRDVDCVITTGEIQRLMREKGWDLSTRVESEDSTKPTDSMLLPELVMHPGTSSGSYLHSLISLVSKLPENQGRPLELTSRTIRSADYEEFVLKDTATDEIVFKGAKCYGFRNLQNVVRKVGKESGVKGLPGGAVRGRARRRVEGRAVLQDKGYDFVEVMACPSGCVNGGGQIRPPTAKAAENRTLDAEGFPRQWEKEGAKVDEMDVAMPEIMTDPSAKWGDKDWIKKVEAAYWPAEKAEDRAAYERCDVFAEQVLEEVCEPQMSQGDWMQSMNGDAEERRREVFRTSYRKVESEVIGIAVKW